MIRPVCLEDLSSAASIAVAAGLFGEDDVQVPQQMISDLLAGKSAGHRCVVDENEGEVVGLAYYAPAVATDGTWYLIMVAVRPDRQGQGRGSALMQHVETALKDDQQRILLVETSGDAACERTRQFYVKCCYEQEARVRDYYAAGEDMVLFRKAVAGPTS
jgi:ribosomal protein S18 acetylase RimI-like enzyme